MMFCWNMDTVKSESALFFKCVESFWIFQGLKSFGSIRCIGRRRALSLQGTQLKNQIKAGRAKAAGFWKSLETEQESLCFWSYFEEHVCLSTYLNKLVALLCGECRVLGLRSHCEASKSRFQVISKTARVTEEFKLIVGHPIWTSRHSLSFRDSPAERFIAHLCFSCHGAPEGLRILLMVVGVARGWVIGGIYRCKWQDPKD